METIAEQPTINHREPSLKDVAKRAGVTTMTVSRALRNLGNVTPETQARIEAAARAVGYNAHCRQCRNVGTSFIVQEAGRGKLKFCSRPCVAAFFST